MRVCFKSAWGHAVQASLHVTGQRASRLALLAAAGQQPAAEPGLPLLHGGRPLVHARLLPQWPSAAAACFGVT